MEFSTMIRGAEAVRLTPPICSCKFTSVQFDKFCFCFKSSLHQKILLPLDLAWRIRESLLKDVVHFVSHANQAISYRRQAGWIEGYLSSSTMW